MNTRKCRARMNKTMKLVKSIYKKKGKQWITRKQEKRARQEYMRACLKE